MTVKGLTTAVRILFGILVLGILVFAICFWPGDLLRSGWSVVGPQGPAGAQGAVGLKGDTGPAMDPATLLADPAFKAIVDQTVATQIAALPPTKVDATVAQSVSAATPTTPLVATCVLDSFPENARFGVQLTVKQLTGTDWEFDPSHASRVTGDVTHPELKADADLFGCPMLIEGRKILNQEHHIWILMPGDRQYLDTDGIFRAKEFSAWAYPSDWNMENFSTAKPPVAAEFIDAKRNNQQVNGYDWPIYVHLNSGNTLEFKPGTKVGAVLPNNCDFVDPSHLNVTGVYNTSNKTFDASIGGENCWTAAKVDGKWTTWQNAKDNVVFTTIEAWLMPSTWDKTQIDAWIAKQQ